MQHPEPILSLFHGQLMVCRTELWGDRVPRRADFRLPLSAPETIRVLQLCEVSECLWMQTVIVPWPGSYGPSLTEGKVPSTAI